MIKVIFILIMVSSCSVISYGQLPELIKDSIYGRDIKITEEFYNSQPYSFAKIKIGNSIAAIAVLASSRNEKYLWVSQDGARIFTNNGRITLTTGLQHNIKILEGEENITQSSFVNFNSSDFNKRKVLLEVSNPHAILSQELTLVEKGLDNEYFSSMLYQEDFTSGKLAFAGENYYWVDPNGRVIKTEQYVHPKLPKIIIEFYFK